MLRRFIVLFVLLSASLLVASGCEKKEEKKETKKSESTEEPQEVAEAGEEKPDATEPTAAADEDAVAPTPDVAETAPADVAEPEPEPAALTPETLDPNVVIPVGQLKAAVMGWADKEVTVGGHLWLFHGEEGPLADKTVLSDSPTAKEKLLECVMKEKPADPIKRTDPLVLKGTYVEAHSMWKQIKMKDCTFVSAGEAFASDTAANPNQLDKPIPVRALYDAGFGWYGKEVQVVGRYWGSTFSSASGETRIDLQDAEGKKAIGCHFKGKGTPQSATDSRDGVIMKGTIDDVVFGSLYLKDCVWMNRE